MARRTRKLVGNRTLGKRAWHRFFAMSDFRAGWQDAREGKGWRPEYETAEATWQTQYEKGRLLALATGAPVDIPVTPAALKENKVLLQWLINMWWEHVTKSECPAIPPAFNPDESEVT